MKVLGMFAALLVSLFIVTPIQAQTEEEAYDEIANATTGVTASSEQALYADYGFLDLYQMSYDLAVAQEAGNIADPDTAWAAIDNAQYYGGETNFYLSKATEDDSDASGLLSDAANYLIEEDWSSAAFSAYESENQSLMFGQHMMDAGERYGYYQDYLAEASGYIYP